MKITADNGKDIKLKCLVSADNHIIIYDPESNMYSVYEGEETGQDHPNLYYLIKRNEERPIWTKKDNL